MLSICLDIAKSCKAHCLRLAKMGAETSSVEGLTEIESYTSQLKRDRQLVLRIIRQSEGTSTLVREGQSLGRTDL